MEELRKSDYLGTEKLSRLMLKFSIPCILSLLISALYNVVDQIFIGNSELSTLGNAATGVVFPVFIIAQAFAWGIGDGCAAYLNICQGRSDNALVPKAIGTGISMTFIAGLIIVGIFFPLRESVLLLFGASSQSIDYAVQYLEIILIFIPFFMLSNMMNSIIRADGSPSVAMIALIVGAVTNIILDPIFIFACHWGMRGAAFATGIGQLASLSISVWYFTRTKTFKITIRNLIPDFKAVAESLTLGISPFISQITMVVMSLLSNILFAKYGGSSIYGEDIPIAIMGILSKVFTVIVNVVVGIVLGCQPIVSYNMGAKNYDRVKSIYKRMLIATLVIGLSATLLFQLAPVAVVKMFGTPTNIPNPDDYWVFGRKAFRIYLALISFHCVIKMNSIFFQSVGNTWRAVITSIIRDIICFIPLIILMPMALGIEGILIASPIADAVAMTVTLILIITFFKKVSKMEKASKNTKDEQSQSDSDN